MSGSVVKRSSGLPGGCWRRERGLVRLVRPVGDAARGLYRWDETQQSDTKVAEK